MRPYESARTRAQLVDVLLSAQIALYALRLLGALWTAAAPQSPLATMFERGARLSQPFLLVLFIGTAIALLFWIDRSVRNLPSLSASEPIAPEHAVGVFFAPPFNLVAIPYVLHHVWRASDPTPPRRRWLLLTWWLPLVAAFPLDSTFVVATMMLASAASLVTIVRDTQRRQDEHFRDDELRRAVPLPTADALR